MTTSQTPAPKTLRSDVHRPSQIVPTDYEFQFRFYLGGWYKRQPIQKIHFDKLEACLPC